MSSSPVEAVDENRILACALGAHLELDVTRAAGLARFAALFLRWNQRINLGGDISGSQLVDRHFLDAFVAARFVGRADRVVDVGSGGGLPLLPLALVLQEARFESFEPTAKKVAFLRTAVREMGLTPRVTLNQRRLGEPLDRGVAGQFDVATSRATFAPEVWLALGMKLVRPGGRVVVFGTSEALPGGSVAPDEVASYASNRRLLVFRRPG